MTQIRYHNYLRPLESLPENYRLLGSLWPGRYCGWDSFVFAGTTGTVSHSSSGVKKTNLIPTTQDGPMGLVVTNQGVHVFEDADDSTVVVDFNTGNGFERIDLLIVTHEHTEVGGGTSAVYSVIKGALGGPVEPPISNVNTQVKMGTFSIAPSAVDHSGTKYHPATPIGLGGAQSYIRQTGGDSIAQKNQYNDMDMNHMREPGLFLTSQVTLNRPVAVTQFSVWVAKSGNLLTQLAIDNNFGKSYSRNSTNGGTSWNVWQSLNNSDISDSLTNVISAVGSAGPEGSVSYTPNNYVGDGTSLVDAINALDVQALVNATDASNAQGDATTALGLVGNTAYSSTTYVTNLESATLAIGDLDAQLTITESGRSANFTTSFNNGLDITLLELAVGSSTGAPGMTYGTANFVTSGEAARLAIIDLDVQLKISADLATANAGRLTTIENEAARTAANESISGDWTFTNANGVTFNNGFNNPDLNSTLIGKKYEVYTMELGAWNMTTPGSKSFGHSLAANQYKKVRMIQAIIIDDANSVYSILPKFAASGASADAYVSSIGASDFGMTTVAGGFFDNTNYNGAGNRGFITVWMVDDPTSA